MMQGNLALKLENFEDDYDYPHLVDDERNLPDNIIQFPLSKPNSNVYTYDYEKTDQSQCGFFV